MQGPDEDDFEEGVHYISYFLLDSIAEDKPEPATTEEFERLIPKVELAPRNCVIGTGEDFTVPTSYSRSPCQATGCRWPRGSRGTSVPNC